jgi:hypothetical protein
MKNPQVGETWLDKTGQRISIIKIAGGTHPVIGMNEKKVLVSYREDGLIHGPDFPQPKDLVRKV